MEKFHSIGVKEDVFVELMRRKKVPSESYNSVVEELLNEARKHKKRRK